MLSGRIALGLLGGMVLPWAAVFVLEGSTTTPAGPGFMLATATIVTIAAELIERRLFFLASVAPRMPGMAR
jgi:hypothetical protein